MPVLDDRTYAVPAGRDEPGRWVTVTVYENGRWVRVRRWVKRLAYVYDAICAATPETAQEGAWVEHDGDVSKAPPPSAQVEVRYRGPELNEDAIGEVGRADELAWDWCGSPTDVVMWRYA